MSTATTHTMIRRRLLALGGGGMLLLTGLSGCGGGGDDGSGDPGGDAGSGGGGGGGTPTGPLGGNGIAAVGTPGAAVSTAARSASLDAVEAAARGLAGADGHIDAEALARQLAASSAFQRVGVSATSGNAWAVYTDGRLLVVPNVPADGSAAPGAAPRKQAAARKRSAAGDDELPALLAARQYRHLDMIGAIPNLAVPHVTRDWVDQDTLPSLRRLAAGIGFHVVNTSDVAPRTEVPETEVDALRQVSGDGVFFLTGLAGSVEAEGRECGAIETTTKTSEALDAAYAADLDAGRLVYSVSFVPGPEGAAGRRVYAITPEFARTSGWSFPFNSIVILNVGGGGMFRYWQGLLGAAGASSLMSWPGPVPVRRLLAFAEDFVHLALATNTLEGQRFDAQLPPRQRAYGIGETIDFLDRNGQTGAFEGVPPLDYLPSGSGSNYVNCLVPTIAYAIVKEGEHATWELNGLFGREWGGKVVRGKALGRYDDALLGQAADPPVQGIETLRVNDWKGDYLKGELDDFDCGYIQVVNDGRVSNVVRITRWTIPLTLRTTITGGLVRETSVEVQLRADLRGWRLTFGERSGDRNTVPVVLVARHGAVATYSAHGEISQTLGIRTTTLGWSGSGLIDPRLPSDMLNFSGVFDWHAKTLQASFAVAGGVIQAHTVVTERGEVVNESTVDAGFAAVAPTSPDKPLELRFDAAWNLAAGEYRSPPVPISMLGDRFEETVLSWPRVIAEFPPVDDEGV